MDCPYCHKELAPLEPCPACQRPAITGASFCHNCGHQLPAPAGEPLKLLACASCGYPALPAAKYCVDCGEPLAAQDEASPEGGFDPGQRIACSDGMCIGIIGPDGKCSEYGKPHNPNAD